MPTETFLYETRNDGSRRVMHKIHANSLFFGFRIPAKISKSQWTNESQLWIANKLRNGWIQNGDMDPKDLTISRKEYVSGAGETWFHELERVAA